MVSIFLSLFTDATINVYLKFILFVMLFQLYTIYTKSKAWNPNVYLLDFYNSSI